jgi:hypothetical protein
VIWSLVRKPGGFARYVYREEMFPQPVFRAAYDAIQAAQPGTKGDVTYLRILHLAASTLEADVAAALAQLQTAGTPITVDAVKALIAPLSAAVAVPALAATAVDLAEYDALLDAQGAAPTAPGSAPAMTTLEAGNRNSLSRCLQPDARRRQSRPHGSGRRTSPPAIGVVYDGAWVRYGSSFDCPTTPRGSRSSIRATGPSSWQRVRRSIQARPCVSISTLMAGW